MRIRIATVALLSVAGAAMAQNGGDGERLALVLNGGWTYDELTALPGLTTGSPITFTLDTPAYFRITDDFVIGDIWTAIGFGSSAFGPPRPPTTFGGGGEAAWQSGVYSTFEIILGPGAYSIDITGDGGGGLPAGVWLQLEKVPAPGAIALLGLGGLVDARRRR